jgi:hypothetical protein
MSRTDQIFEELAAALDDDNRQWMAKLLEELATHIGWEQAANAHERLVREWLKRQRRAKGR